MVIIRSVMVLTVELSAEQGHGRGRTSWKEGVGTPAVIAHNSRTRGELGELGEICSEASFVGAWRGAVPKWTI